MYRNIIKKSLAAINRTDIDPRHAEAYIRLEHSTLDGLSAEKFRQECEIAAACVDEGGISAAEFLAESFGL